MLCVCALLNEYACVCRVSARWRALAFIRGFRATLVLGGGSGFVYLCTRLDKHQLLNIYSACSFAEHKSVRVRGHPPFCFEVVLKRFEVARLDLFIPIT